MCLQDPGMSKSLAESAAPAPAALPEFFAGCFLCSEAFATGFIPWQKQQRGRQYSSSLGLENTVDRGIFWAQLWNHKQFAVPSYGVLMLFFPRAGKTGLEDLDFLTLLIHAQVLIPSVFSS